MISSAIFMSPHESADLNTPSPSGRLKYTEPHVRCEAKAAVLITSLNTHFKEYQA